MKRIPGENVETLICDRGEQYKVAGPFAEARMTQAWLKPDAAIRVDAPGDAPGFLFVGTILVGGQSINVGMQASAATLKPALTALADILGRDRGARPPGACL